MVKRLVVPQPSQKYDPDRELIRNREIEAAFKAMAEKINELESRLVAGGL